VKWILVIPHIVVLFFLWIAFTVVWVIAFFAILFTERYPRALFDFSLGVLRWSWRVAQYTYGALATDRYPPFSLGEEPDYPAEVVAAGRPALRRPRLLRGRPALRPVERRPGDGHGGDRRRGPRLHREVPPGPVRPDHGLNLWVLRVAAYAALMTDAYPPFRLDMGATEP
jgi:hypothetical protein